MTHTLIHGYVTLTTTDGTSLRLDSRCSGVKTGYARIGNPYWDGDPDWRFKDGDTCIETTADDWRAMPIADAYQELYRRFDEELNQFRLAYQMEEAREQDAEKAQRQQDALPYSEAHLYEIQDALR